MRPPMHLGSLWVRVFLPAPLLCGCALTTDLEGLSGGRTFPDAGLEAGGGDTSVEADQEAGEGAVETGPEGGEDAPEDAPFDVSDAQDAPDEGADADPCPLAEGADYCALIPRLAVGAQQMDGIGDEFCPEPAMRLAADTAEFWQGYVTGDSQGWMRAAWSPEGLHFHVRVLQQEVKAPEETDPLWFGDGIELFLKGDANLTGAYDADKDLGAIQILLVPPSPSGPLPARAQTFRGGNYIDVVDAGQYTARLVPEGYEIELRVPWAKLVPSGAALPASGDPVAFNWALDYRSRFVAERLWQLFVHYTEVPGGIPCMGGLVEPACDDRTWCTPVLE